MSAFPIRYRGDVISPTPSSPKTSVSLTKHASLCANDPKRIVSSSRFSPRNVATSHRFHDAPSTKENSAREYVSVGEDGACSKRKQNSCGRCYFKTTPHRGPKPGPPLLRSNFSLSVTGDENVAPQLGRMPAFHSRRRTVSERRTNRQVCVDRLLRFREGVMMDRPSSSKFRYQL